MTIINLIDIIGRTYLSTAEDCTKMRLRIFEAIENLVCSINQDTNVIHFPAENDDATYE